MISGNIRVLSIDYCTKKVKGNIVKKQFIYGIFLLVLLIAGLSACSVSADVLTETLTEGQTWQDLYAGVLRESNDKEFFLCDIEGDGVPELLVGGPETDTGKYANYDVYIYKNNVTECIGDVGTLSWSCLWLDHSGGILGYSYGAGGGGTYRCYIEDGKLYEDGEIYGYRFDDNGTQVEWFRGRDGNEIIVTEETEDEYQSILDAHIEIQRSDITEANILKVIYSEG